MKIKKRALLTAFTVAVVLVAGCSASQDKNAAGEQELAAFTKGKALSGSFVDARAANMKGIADNGKLRLLADEKTGSIAVIHQASGQIWYSNPPERDADKIAAGVNKDLLSSQVVIDYYNSFGQLNSMNSFTDSVAYDQVAFEPIEQGVKVLYQFGKLQKTFEDMPMMISKERFNALSAKLDKTGQRSLLVGYKEDAAKERYERNDSALVGLQLEKALKALEAAGYTEEDLEEDMKELGFNQTKAESRIFRVVVEYKLDGEALVANIPQAGIYYPKEYPIHTISLLSMFGAGGAQESGSMLVPDGSGALIHFNNGKAKYPAYRQLVYGLDRTDDTREKLGKEETVRLPVFGIIKSNSAVLGVIEKGASLASVNADVAGRINSFNYTYPSFTVINKGDVTLSGESKNSTFPKFQQHASNTDYTVRYTFLKKEEASYVGLAQAYRKYLISTNGLPQASEAAANKDASFHLQLVGGISKKKHFAGIPYHTIESLTTVDQAQAIVKQLQERGIGNISLKYSGWFNGGQNHKVPEKIKVDSEIGGKKALTQFVSKAKEQNVTVYPDFAVLTAYSTSGFSKSDDAARTLRGLPASIYPLDLALDMRFRQNGPPSYVVAPRLVDGYVNTIIKQMGSSKIGNVSLRDLADQLDSDYRKNGQIDRSQSEAISVQALSKLQESGLGIMADGGNAYALPYLEAVTNAPLSSSNYKMEDESIPFYQMVIRGLVDYSGAPYNLSTHRSSKQYVLKSLEYGANVSFEWIYESNSQMKDTDFSELFAVHYGDTIDQATAIYKEVNDVLKKVSGQSILSHQKLAEGVYKTVYSNKTYVIVNYNSSPATVEGKTIAAESYSTGGGEA